MASEGEVQFSEILDIRSPNADKKPKTMKACVLLVLSILNIPELMAVVIVFQPNNKYSIMLSTEDFIQKNMLIIPLPVPALNIMLSTIQTAPSYLDFAYSYSHPLRLDFHDENLSLDLFEVSQLHLKVDNN